jgi:cell shape-determining protein MreC
MLIIVLIIIGILLSLFLPMGLAIVISIIFAVVIMNYRKTLQIHRDLQDIRSHFDLLKGYEKEDYEIEQQLKEHEMLDNKSLENINQQIEEELEKNTRIT